MLELSIIIGVHNGWEMLAECLQTIKEQQGSPSFEVIVVDDGSDEPAPAYIREYSQAYRLSIIRESHAGIAAARNRGIKESQGAVLVFTDADCRFEPGCLSAIGSTLSQLCHHNYFQLHLVGDRSTLLGRAEELRLIAIQEHALQRDGCIRYLNTAGFAVRRSQAENNVPLFDPSARRAEDTLLLANVMERGELPLFLRNATVRHSVRLSFREVLRKDVCGTWLEGNTFETISSKGLQLRMGHAERFGMLLSMWITSGERALGRTAWLALVGRQSLQRIVSAVHSCLRVGSNPQPSANRSHS